VFSPPPPPPLVYKRKAQIPLEPVGAVAAASVENDPETEPDDEDGEAGAEDDPGRAEPDEDPDEHVLSLE
jgi:hypothetical protein